MARGTAFARFYLQSLQGLTANAAGRKQRRENIMRIITWTTLIVLCGGTALAQEFKPDPADEAAARREGALTWYTSTPVAAAQHIANTFQQKYGIKVELLRTGGQNVIRRFQQEADAGRIAV